MCVFMVVVAQSLSVAVNKAGDFSSALSIARSNNIQSYVSVLSLNS